MLTEENKLDKYNEIMEIIKDFNHLETVPKDLSSVDLNFLYENIHNILYGNDCNTATVLPNLKDYKNILLVDFNVIGDFVLSSGLIREIRNMFPNSRITLLCLAGACYTLAKNCPYVDKIIILYDGIKGVHNFITFCYNEIWPEHFDLAISLGYICMVPMSYVMLACGVPVRYGYKVDVDRKYYIHGNAYNRLLNQFKPLEKYIFSHVADHSYDLMETVDRYFYLIEQQTHKPAVNRELEVWLDTKTIEKMKQRLQPYSKNKLIVIGIGGSDPNKRYSIDQLIEVLNMIKENFSDELVIIGGRKEIKDAQKISKHVKCLNLVGKTSALESAAALSQSDMYLGNDTGMMHVAAALKVPVVWICREAVDKEKLHCGLGSYLSFFPYKTKAICIRPEHAADECQSVFIDGGCGRLEAHCINQNTPEDIFNAFVRLRNQPESVKERQY